MEELAKLFIILDCLNTETPLDLKKKAYILKKAFSDHEFKHIRSIQILGSTIDFCRKNPDKGHFLALGMTTKYSEERMRKMHGVFERATSDMKSRVLDHERLESIYVGLTENGNVNIPGKTEGERAFKKIEMVFDLFQIFLLSKIHNSQLKTIIKNFKNKLTESCPSLEKLSKLSEKIYFPRIEKELAAYMQMKEEKE